MKRKPIFPMTVEELEAMPTRQLLGRLHQLRMCIESFEHDDLYEPPPDDGRIRFKQTEEWRAAYREVKAVLDTREHVHRCQEDVRLVLVCLWSLGQAAAFLDPRCVISAAGSEYVPVLIKYT